MSETINVDKSPISKLDCELMIVGERVKADGEITYVAYLRIPDDEGGAFWLRPLNMKEGAPFSGYMLITNQHMVDELEGAYQKEEKEIAK